MRNDFLTDIEWVRIAPDKVVVATADRVWLYRPSSGDNSNFLAQPRSGASSVATTQKLLDTSIVLAKRAILSSHRPPALNPTRWIWHLAGQYHLTHFTPQLMQKAAQIFAAAGRYSLAQWATQKAIEERGHDRLALLDIQSLGYKAEAVVEALVPLSAEVLLDYFTRSVESSDPISCVGYSYTLERLALAISEEYIQAVETLLPLGTNATRCLRVHSGVGSDVEHVEETVELIAALTPEERTCVAIACYETALLYFSSPQRGYPSDEKLQQILRPLVVRPCQPKKSDYLLLKR
jgi:pyrroloquinoline quinone (PQQ) biosynthesis protein C